MQERAFGFPCFVLEMDTCKEFVVMCAGVAAFTFFSSFIIAWIYYFWICRWLVHLFVMCDKLLKLFPAPCQELSGNATVTRFETVNISTVFRSIELALDRCYSTWARAHLVSSPHLCARTENGKREKSWTSTHARSAGHAYLGKISNTTESQIAFFIVLYCKKTESCIISELLKLIFLHLNTRTAFSYHDDKCT